MEGIEIQWYSGSWGCLYQHLTVGICWVTAWPTRTENMATISSIGSVTGCKNSRKKYCNHLKLLYTYFSKSVYANSATLTRLQSEQGVCYLSFIQVFCETITSNSVFRDVSPPPWIFSFYTTVTLEIRSRSPKSNQFFVMSHLYILESLVRIQPLVHKILCRHESARRCQHQRDLHQKQYVPLPIGEGT